MEKEQQRLNTRPVRSCGTSRQVMRINLPHTLLAVCWSQKHTSKLVMHVFVIGHMNPTVRLSARTQSSRQFRRLCVHCFTPSLSPGHWKDQFGQALRGQRSRRPVGTHTSALRHTSVFAQNMSAYFRQACHVKPNEKQTVAAAAALPAIWRALPIRVAKVEVPLAPARAVVGFALLLLLTVVHARPALWSSTTRRPVRFAHLLRLTVVMSWSARWRRALLATWKTSCIAIVASHSASGVVRKIAPQHSPLVALARRSRHARRVRPLEVALVVVLETAERLQQIAVGTGRKWFMRSRHTYIACARAVAGRWIGHALTRIWARERVRSSAAVAALTQSRYATREVPGTGKRACRAMVPRARRRPADHLTRVKEAARSAFDSTKVLHDDGFGSTTAAHKRWIRKSHIQPKIAGVTGSAHLVVPGLIAETQVQVGHARPVHGAPESYSHVVGQKAVLEAASQGRRASRHIIGATGALDVPR